MLFIASQKLFSVSVYLSFCHDFLVMQKKRLDKNDKVNFKIYDVTTWLTNNCNIYILPNISRGKGNQALKFGQLIKCNMRNIFVEKSCTKWAGETIPWPLPKKSKLSISLEQLCKVLNSLFLLCANLRAIEIESNQAADHFF